MYARRATTVVATILSLTACGGGSGGGGALQVYPDRIEVASDLGIGSLEVIAVSTDPLKRVCPAGSVDFPVMHTTQLDAFTWRVEFDPRSDLAVGEHRGQVGVFLSASDQCTSGSGAVRIPYRVVLVHGFAWPEGVTLHAGTLTAAGELRGSARIDMASGPPHRWSARSGSPWIVVDAPSGMTGDDVHFSVDPAGLPGDQNGTTVQGSIEITGDAEGMTARSVQVSLELALAQPRSALPPAQIAGASTRFRVHGLGFTSDPGLLAHLAIEGIPGAVFHRVSDEELVVDVPPTAAGTYALGATNALGVPTGSIDLRLVPPLETGRAVLPGSGSAGKLLWDPGRAALLALEPGFFYYYGSPLIRRHVPTAHGWATWERIVQDVVRIGFTPDGEQLVTTSLFDPVTLLDPVTLEDEGRYAPLTNVGTEPPLTAPLSVTSDGIAWIRAPYADERYIAFDLSNHQFRLFPDDVWPEGFVPEGSLASRDGGRLLVSTANGGPFLYRDTAEGAPHVNPAGLASFDSMDDQGSRILSGANVYDGSFALLGRLSGPGILSGNGRRAYVLESRSDWRQGGAAPLLHVFDVTAPAPAGGALPELGTVDLLDHAVCGREERTCAPTSSLVVTPDGRVVFVQTDGGVVVVPIPEALL